MFGTSILLFVVTAKLVSFSDESSLVRVREDALARAFKSKDKTVLSALTDKDFSLHLTCGSVVRNFSSEVLREDWIDDLIDLQIDSYEAVISKVKVYSIKARRPNPDYKAAETSMAFVSLDEYWTLHSPQGRRIEERFRTTDTWLKQQGTWKLTGRFSALNPRDCTDGKAWP